MHSSNRHFPLYPIILFIVSVLLIFIDNYTFSSAAILILLRQSAILGFLSIGLGVVVLAGSIDLSAGAILSLGSSVCFLILSRTADVAIPAVLITLAICTACGLLNGIMVAQFQLPAVILTFTQAFVYLGISFICNLSTAGWLAPSAFCDATNKSIGVIPVSTLIWFILLAAVSSAMSHTYWGQYIYAVGENEQALLILGIHTGRYKICAHAICGFFSGLAGIFMMARISSAQVNTNFSLVLEGLATLSFGGIHFSGSMGKLHGLLLGTLVLTLLKMCMTVYGLPNDIQRMILAILFLGSLFIGWLRKN